MLSILERIDPHSDRIDVLVELVDELRPRRSSDAEYAIDRVRLLCQLLKGKPAQASALRSYVTRLLESRRHASLYTDIGILSNDGFVTELKTRFAYRFLPPALGDTYLADAIDQVLYVETDHLWVNAVPAVYWLELFDIVTHAPPVIGAEQANVRVRRYGGDNVVGFADGYPFLVTNEGSLASGLVRNSAKRRKQR